MSASKDKSAMPAWHPNFRIAETLPDTKIIRTSFLVNAAAASLLLGLGALFVLREMDVRAVDAESDKLTEEMAKLSVEHRAAIPLQKEFTDSEKRFAEVEAFRNGSWPASRLLERLSATLPRMVSLTLLDVQGGAIDLGGTIAGSPDQGSGIFSAYLETLTKDAQLAEVVTNIRQSTIRRDPQTNQLTFVIKMNLKKGK